MITSGWLSTTASHSNWNEPVSLSPKQFSPPAISTISGTQWPPQNMGSTHSTCSTLGRALDRAARLGNRVDALLHPGRDLLGFLVRAGGVAHAADVCQDVAQVLGVEG